MVSCDSSGTVSMFISKMIPIKKDPGRFIAFGRVFSGTLRRGQDLTILGVDGGGGRKKVQGIQLMMGSKAESLSECPAGNVCGVMGIDRCLTKSGTLSDSAQCFPFKTMTFSVSPVVKVAVNVIDSRNLPKLIEGLKRLSKYDGIVQIERNKQGQHVVAEWVNCIWKHVSTLCAMTLCKMFPFRRELRSCRSVRALVVHRDRLRFPMAFCHR